MKINVICTVCSTLATSDRQYRPYVLDDPYHLSSPYGWFPVPSLTTTNRHDTHLFLHACLAVNNTLDLFLSNRPTLINRVEPLPGISDHDTMVFVVTSIKSMRQRPNRRKILLWKHVDYDMLKAQVANLSNDIINIYYMTTPINTLWSIFRKGIETIMESIPSKMSTTRFNQTLD